MYQVPGTWYRVQQCDTTYRLRSRGHTSTPPYAIQQDDPARLLMLQQHDTTCNSNLAQIPRATRRDAVKRWEPAFALSTNCFPPLVPLTGSSTLLQELLVHLYSNVKMQTTTRWHSRGLPRHTRWALLSRQCPEKNKYTCFLVWICAGYRSSILFV